MELTGKELRQMHLTRLGKIMSNLAVMGIIFALGGLLSYLFFALYYLLMGLLVLITFGLILLGGFNPFNSSNGVFERLTAFFSQSAIYVAAITMVCAVVAMALLLRDKQEKHGGRICSCVFTIILSVIVIVVKMSQMAQGGGA